MQHKFGLFASDAIKIERVRAIATNITINRISVATKMLVRLFCSDADVSLANHSKCTRLDLTRCVRRDFVVSWIFSADARSNGM